MIADLNAEFDLDLVIGALVNAPTIERLAGHIESERHKRQDGDRYLIQLQPGSARRPVFFVPGGIGGDSEFFVYARLARHVGSHYPFYGLRARSAQGTESSQSSVKEMASDYVAAIRSVQPRGPYYVVGECAGGIVAYEIAQQLHGRGEEIALLVLMDTPRPDFFLEVRRRLTRLFRPILASPFGTRLSAQWGQLRQRTMLGAASYLVEKSGKIFQGAGQAPPASSGPRIDRSIEHVQRSYSRAIYAYRPRPYPGRMTLLVHEESHRDDHRATLGWKDLVVGGIELHLLPGNHVTYIRDHVEAAAHQIRACIDKADAQPPESRTMERRDLPRSAAT
jgi:thioesterase domain-containing protein